MNDPTKKLRPSLMLTKDAEFGARCDDADPFICSREVLQLLIDDSPGEFEMGFLTGVYQYREQMAILTEIKFD